MEFKMRLEGDDNNEDVTSTSESEGLSLSSDSTESDELNKTIEEPIEERVEEKKPMDEYDALRPLDDEPVIITTTSTAKAEKSNSFITDRKSLNIFVLVCAAMLLLSTLLPHWSISMQSSFQNATEQAIGSESTAEVGQELTDLTGAMLVTSPVYAIILILCSIAEIVLAFLKQNRYMKIVSVAALVVAGRYAFNMFISSSIMSALFAVKFAGGFWTMIISTVLLIASAFYRDFFGTLNVNED